MRIVEQFFIQHYLLVLNVELLRKLIFLDCICDLFIAVCNDLLEMNVICI